LSRANLTCLTLTCALSLLPPLTFTTPPPPQLYTLSLHDALPISARHGSPSPRRRASTMWRCSGGSGAPAEYRAIPLSANPYSCRDRKSTRLNSSHVAISYAVFCLKKKRKDERRWTCCPR